MEENQEPSRKWDDGTPFEAEKKESDSASFGRDPSMEPSRFQRPDPEEAAVVDDDEPEPKKFSDALGSSGVEVVNQTLYDQEVPSVATFKDHFTLPIPTSMVRYRGQKGAARVIENSDAYQFVLEETSDGTKSEVTIRRIQDTSGGVTFLRTVYSIVAAFFAGFVFVVSLMILLFLFLDLAITLGITDRESNAKWFAALGAIFAILPLIHGLASGMVLAGAFVKDTWTGHHLIKNFTLARLTPVTMEWVFFTFFLGLPIFVMCCGMLAQSDEWWVIGGTFWVCSIAFFFVMFCASVIYFEAMACVEVMKNQYNNDDDSWWSLIERSIMLRQVATYAGQMNRTYLSRGSMEDSEATDKKGRENIVESTLHETKNWRAHVNQFLMRFGLFEECETPTRSFSVDDARDVRPYITSHTWSLEKIFCRPKNSRYVSIISGAGAVTRAQMRSSFFCSIIGNILILFMILSVLIYLQAGAPATGFLMIVAIVVTIPSLRRTLRLARVAKDVINARTDSKSRDVEELTAGIEEDDFASRSFYQRSTNSEGMYIVEESYRLSQPTMTTAWFLFWTEIVFLFLWPMFSLFSVGNWPLALTYFVIIGLSGLRYYFNAAIVLEEVGHMEMLRGETTKETWRNQSRLDDIVGQITRGRSKGAWVTVIAIFAAVFLALFAGALGTDNSTAEIEDPTYTYMTQWQYTPIENSLRYPTCTLTSELQESPLTSMADYIFLTRVAYRGNVTQRELDNWFGEGIATDEKEFVETFRAENGMESSVHFKLISYPSKNGGNPFAFLAIRGTTNAWEAMADAQLWSGAMLTQVLREVLPIGSIFTSVAPYLIKAAASIESEAIDQISFYKDTVKFTKSIQASGDYSGIVVAGHSLGGGLSMMTGAIAKVPSIALSGPNTMLTRKSLDPPVSIEDLDRYTFNIIPERDVVPMIDDPAQNVQEIRCNADFTDTVGCHDTTRALCEAIFTCGSNGRPIPCACVTVYGFPEPESIDGETISFREACELQSDDQETAN